MTNDRRNRVAQWAYDTRGVLGRFHLWLEDVEESWHGERAPTDHAFVGESLERAFIAANAVTALGTRLFGRYGEGRNADKATVNRVKKDADAVSAYALSEALWYLTRNLPENHAVMVSLGEGLMPKAGETPEMGSNPQLGFGRVYARPQVARFLDRCVTRLLNEPGYEWPAFWHEIQAAGLTVWGAAVDTLENTSRFAKGSPTGALTVLHLFDQPLRVARPYEGYMGNLVLPREVVDQAAERSILIDFLTPRSLIMEAIAATYPGIRPDHVHVWTLGGASREHRIGRLWSEWRSLGAHVVEDGWVVPSTGIPAFTESGTYAPVYCVGPSTQDGEPHLFICDGYSASAEAMQAASLDPILGTQTSMCLFSSRFNISYEREHRLMRLDPDAVDYASRLDELAGQPVDRATVEVYRNNLREARAACMPVTRRTSTADDFFPNKEWRVLSLSSAMLPDPYTGIPGVDQVGDDIFRVTTRAATRAGMVDVALSLRLMEPVDEMRMVFSPLLDRFYAGQDYRARAVKISDSGRIRNELQTLCSEAIEYLPEGRMVVRFDAVDDAVLAPDKKALIREVLAWYRRVHPIWFRWLESD
ncbi:MAG: hypothetical protein MUC56_07780 [Thermoanaerobaculales bacterium]|jgi:hypothetical protein|nr:hypothetical protein [Thermoanaerobaculales bacterium]